MAGFKYCIKEIKDLEQLGRRRKKELLEELQECEGLAGKGDLEAVYRCFELSALIELIDSCEIKYGKAAFLYLEEAAKRGYTKAVKVYIVMMLKGFDIRVLIQEIIHSSVNRFTPTRTDFIDIITPETNFRQKIRRGIRT